MIKKLDFKFVNELRRNEHVKELVDKVNEVIDGANPLIEHISYDNTERQLELDSDLYTDGDIECQDLNVNGTLYLGGSQSAKKIYCHPIAIRDNGYDSNYKLRLTCLIFNNSNTPFTRSMFKQFIDTLNTQTEGVGKIMVSGAFYNGSQMIIASYLFKSPTNKYAVIGLNTANDYGAITEDEFETLFPTANTTFEDGVNAIN